MRILINIIQTIDFLDNSNSSIHFKLNYISITNAIRSKKKFFKLYAYIIAFSRAFSMFNSLLHYYQQLHYIKQIDNIVHTCGIV